MAKLIDTHFHLDYYKNHKEIYKLINELEQYTICMTTSPGIYYSCKRMYDETKYLKFALGFHPQSNELNMNDFIDFKRLFKETKYIGEVGLDFTSRYIKTKGVQEKYFKEIIKMCAEENKLISVHLRNANSIGIDIIKEYMPRKCIIHWFKGSKAEMDKLIEIGCYFSINENMVKNSKENQLLLSVPKERILIESDGPFSKVRNEKYRPELLMREYESIACFLNTPDLVTMIYNNFMSILSEKNNISK